MAFTGMNFLFVFLPISLIAYWLFHKNYKIQNLILLLASLFFYVSSAGHSAWVLLACLIVTYTGPRIYEKTNRRWVLVGSLIMNLGALVVFKYTDFLLALAHRDLLGLVAPVGISFYVFQSSAYLIDLLKGKESVEKDFLVYANYVTFFPTILSGPIQRSTYFLPKLKHKRTRSYEQFLQAFLIFLWGMCLKLVLADRIALLVAPVFNEVRVYSGAILFWTMVGYSIQIYADFAGYSYMAIAIASLFGFDLKPNFNHPYLALNIQQFWRRWHISLTSWFTDYLYIPLGGNRKGTFRKYLNIMIVFVVSGLWHGASMHYVVWGFLHGFYQVFGQMTMNVRQTIKQKLHLTTDTLFGRLLSRITLWLLIGIGWVFFRVYSISDGIAFLKGMLMGWRGMGTLILTYMNHIEIWIIVIMTCVLTLVSTYAESDAQLLSKLAKSSLRYGVVVMVLIFVILIFGMYGPGYDASGFIYEGF